MFDPHALKTAMNELKERTGWDDDTLTAKIIEKKKALNTPSVLHAIEELLGEVPATAKDASISV